jgi:hypothetical protein
MTVITTRIRVADDGTISGRVSQNVPAGEHEAWITIREPAPRRTPVKPFSLDDLPTIDLGPWPDGMTLRREEIYGEDGR